MVDEGELRALLNQAEEFCMSTRSVIIKLRDLAEEIEELLKNVPAMSVSRKRKRVRSGDRTYRYDYFEIKIGRRTIYLPETETGVIEVFERAARLASNLSKILKTIHEL